MRIAIDLETFTPKHLGALIAAMFACGTATREAVAHVIAPLGLANASESRSPDPDFEKWYDDAMKASNAAGFAGVTAAETIERLDAELTALRLKFDPKNQSADQLSRLIADLNAELYSRRIPHEDDPSAGATVIAQAVDTAGQTETSAPVDLASVFGMAGAKEVSVGFDLAQGYSAEVKSTAAPLSDLTGGTVPVDKSGLPWDARIHSASKAINQTDGLWRQKRGVDPALVATVNAELRQAMSVPSATGGVIEADKDEPQREYHNDTAEAAAARVKVGIDPAPKTPPPPPRRQAAAPEPQPTSVPVPDTGEIDSFPRLLKFITEQKLAGKLAQTQVAQALVSLGIEGPLPVLQSRPDLIPAMVAKLRAIGGV